MKKDLNILSFVFLLYFLTSALGYAQVKTSLVQRLQKKISNLSSFESSFIFSFQKKNNDHHPLTVSGRIYILNHWMRMDSKIHMDGNSHQKLKSSFYLNSTGFWEVVSSQGKTALIAHADPKMIKKKFSNYFLHRRFVDFLNPAAVITQVHSKQTQFLGETTLRNIKTFVFKIKNPNEIQSFNLPSGKKIKISQIKLWLGTENGICYQELFLGDKDHIISTFELYHFIPNPKISAAKFYYFPPGEKHIHNLTPFMEKILERGKA
jgi:outer membrane lipoprotein-sorting protein